MCYEYATPIALFLAVSMRELLKYSIMDSGEQSATGTGIVKPPLLLVEQLVSVQLTRLLQMPINMEKELDMSGWTMFVALAMRRPCLIAVMRVGELLIAAVLTIAEMRLLSVLMVRRASLMGDTTEL